MNYLHDAHEMNAYRADNVCLSVRTIQLKKLWSVLDEIQYEYYATGNSSKIVLLNVLQSEYQHRGRKIGEVGSTLGPPGTGPYSGI
jgi:hypothetical protein